MEEVGCFYMCKTVVQVFDPNAGNKDERLVRQLKGHERPVHTTRFAPSKFHVLSGSDDATVGALVSEAVMHHWRAFAVKIAIRSCASKHCLETYQSIS